MTPVQSTKLDSAIAAIMAVRKNAPLVHCITNSVAQNFTANCLLACGATPSMTSSSIEVAFFTKHAKALLINLGTLDEDRVKAITLAANIASQENRPLVIDPVMAHISPIRQQLLMNLLETNPSIIRVNKNEAAVLRREQFDLSSVCLVETGPVDTITYQGVTLNLSNGHPWMGRVTAIGCAQGALMAALLPEVKEPDVAALAGLLWTGIAGELASEKSAGPASFAVNFIDQLHNITIDQIIQRALIK